MVCQAHKSSILQKEVLLIEEIWKDIKNYEEMYQISSYGRVRSLDRYVDTNNGKNNFIKDNFLLYVIIKELMFMRYI